MPGLAPDSASTAALLDAVRRGRPRALEDLLTHHRRGLREFVETQFDPRLRARADPSDVVQDTQLEVARRLPEYLAGPPMPFRLWLRRKAVDRLRNLRRDHLRRARRSVARERALADPSALRVVGPLLSRGPSPSQHAQAGELAERVARAVAVLAAADREVLALRHADDLAFDEIAVLLDIDAAAARKRFGRALIRLQAALRAAGLLEGAP